MKDGQNQELEKTIQKKKWFTPYFVVGSIWYFSQKFNETTSDTLIILIVAVLAGVSYYHLKSKIKIKNETVKIILTFVIFWLISALIIGFLTSLIT